MFTLPVMLWWIFLYAILCVDMREFLEQNIQQGKSWAIRYKGFGGYMVELLLKVVAPI